MFRKFFSSKVYKVFDYIMRLILLNVAIFIVSLLLPLLLSNLVKNENLSWLITIAYIPTFFTFLPAIIACLDVIKSYELDHENGVFKSFGEPIFDDYWINYGKIVMRLANGKTKKITKLNDFLKYKGIIK